MAKTIEFLEHISRNSFCVHRIYPYLFLEISECDVCVSVLLRFHAVSSARHYLLHDVHRNLVTTGYVKVPVL